MSSKLKKAIGAVKDQTSISLAKVSSTASSNLEVTILKATSHDDVPIDNKYISEILQLVSSNKTHAAACARAIGKRIGRTRNWVVALKSLMLVLRIFQDGDPYFPREVLHAMKRGAKILNLSSFRDESNSSPWDFTSFVRTVALYLDERLECFLTGKLQRRYKQDISSSSRGYDEYGRSRSSRRSNESIREMKPAMLLDRMSHWQQLLDRAIATRPTGVAKENALVQISLYAIVQESFDIYNDISDGLALILDSFYNLQYQNCVDAFQICLKAVKQFEELNAYYAFCKTMCVGRNFEYPTVQAISEELIETLQEFLKDQSSFSPTTKSTKRQSIPLTTTPRRRVKPSFPSFDSDNNKRHTRDGSYDMDLDMGSRCTSLDDLISATETGKAPAISIDLESYLESQREDVEASETGSTRSLPVMCSVGDLMSLEDCTEKEEIDERLDQEENGVLESLPSINWEKALTEGILSSQFLSDNNTNTFNAFPDPTPVATDSPYTDAITPTNLPTPPNYHYNPFLEDPIESLQSTPTFQATPTFSAQNPNQISPTLQNPNDPFAEFSCEQKLSNPVDQQTLLLQQQTWMQNQSKILAKNWID